ncbi:hypothetical protein B0H16DRAFT_1482022 [Mycena metata]|uniref:Uncharacterized protein n=1 Tax=Mycena metata TaxID=1033252 RepID=A0AAD7M8J3_9AGAR|nr:hypothetical protein B0H16DRAFT_1482022 [Mycena metata]
MSSGSFPAAVSRFISLCSGSFNLIQSWTCDMMVTKVGDEPLHSGWKKLYTNNIATTQPQPPKFLLCQLLNDPGIFGILVQASYHKTGGNMWIWHGIEAPVTLEAVGVKDS